MASPPHSFSFSSYFSASSVSSEAGWSRTLAWDVPEGKTGERVTFVYSVYMYVYVYVY